MATLISRANGNFTDATTWGVAGAASLLDSQTGTTLTTTTYQNSSTFVPAAVAIDAVALKVSARAGIVGTLDVSLYNSTAAAEAGLVTVNLADIPTIGWAVFRLPAPVTPNGTDAYLVRVRHAAGASSVTLFRDGTVANWSRMLRTNTTGVPAAADRLVIAGELMGVGTGTDLTVTMNNTATTIFGDNSTTIPSVTVNKRGTLQLATAAATNYYLKLNSSLLVYDGGTLNLGTSGTPLPVSSTAVVELNSTVAGDFGLEVYGTMNIWGAAKRSWCLLTADIAAAATVLQVQDTTGWQVGDEVCIGSTSRTAAECEKRTILTVDSLTQITLTAGVTFAHSGTAPTQGEVGNLTRNVKIRGISLALTGYIRCYAASQVVARYVQVTGIGANGAGKAGNTIETTTGVCDWQYSSAHELVIGVTGYGFHVTSTTGSGITLAHNVIYNMRHVALLLVTSTGVSTVQNNLFMRSNAVSSADLVTLGDVGGTFTGNHIVGSVANGLLITEAAPIGTMTGNVIHSCAAFGLVCSSNGSYAHTSLSCTIWRCLSRGISFAGIPTDLFFQNCVIFGNGYNVVGANAGGLGSRITFDTCTIAGDSTFPSNGGISVGSGASFSCRLVNCILGVISGIFQGHTVGDVGTTSTTSFLQVVAWNTVFGSTNEIEAPSTAFTYDPSFVKSSNHDQVPGQLRNWYKYGRVESDTTLFSTLAPSLRLIPTSAAGKVSYTICLTAIDAGTAPQVSVKVRQSVIGDGAAYNGALPRLMLRRNEQIGVLVDTVLATATAASVGAWETITGTLPLATNTGKFECYVDADGTVGWINIDDVGLPVALDTRGFLYGLDGERGALPAGYQVVSLTPADQVAIAQASSSAVWDAQRASYTVAGSFGQATASLDTALATSQSTILAAVATISSLTQAQVRSAIGLVSANLDVQLSALAAQVALIKTQTDLLPSDPADQSLIITATTAIQTALTALTTLVSSTGASLSVAERQAVADTILARSLGTEAYAADGAVPTLSEMLFMLLSALTQFGIIATTLTTRRLDGTTPAMTYTLDSASNPTTRVRSS